MTLPQYVLMACSASATAFGLYPRKGSLEVGSDADTVLADLRKREVITAERLHSIGNAAPYENFDVIGALARTIVRGKTVAKNLQPLGVAVPMLHQFF